ncbi:aryl-sulfate sulfotransferase [Lacinutrix himadriensis]|uniref:aryl-sulfate sulfotransferase n=1 Tax=Lacinutrix himadriensis TaxID=641549 RepID=UPI000A6C8284|nr:aryl-sulfate sulfotransferase [Lacinutrix himadriensis]
MNNKTHIVLTLIVSLTFILLNSCTSDDDAATSENLGEIDAITTFGGTKNESAQSVVSTQDGGYAVLGHTQSMDFDITDKPNESYDYWVLKFDAENLLQWNKTYGGTGDDRGNTIIQTTDGGFAILGQSASNDEDVTQNSGAKDYWLTKLDAVGNIIWEKSFGYSGVDVGISLLQTNDNGYFITGILDVSASGGAGNTKHAGGDYWAIKLDATGNTLWSKYYGGSYTDTPHDALETNDGYIIVGSSDSDDVDINNNKGTYDFWVVKIDTTGNIIWEKSFGGSGIDEAWAITNTNDGNYLVVGDTRSNDQDVSNLLGAADLWIIKISPDGDLIWEKTMGGSSFDAGRSISKTQDNGFIISGSSRSVDGDLNANNGQNDAWVFKIDNNANISWQKTVGGTNIDFAYDAIQLQNQSFVAVGESSSDDADLTNNKGFTDLLIIKIK